MVFLVFGAPRQVSNGSTQRALSLVTALITACNSRGGGIFCDLDISSRVGLHVPSGQIPNNEQRISMVRLKTKVGFFRVFFFWSKKFSSWKISHRPN